MYSENLCCRHPLNFLENSAAAGDVCGLRTCQLVAQGAEAENDEQDTPALFIQNRLLQSPPFVRLMAQTPCTAQPGGPP